MSSIVQDAIDLAVIRSQLNDPSTINATTLIKAIALYERQAFIRAALINPGYYGLVGDTSTRAQFMAPWGITATPGGIVALTKVVVKTIVGTVAGVSVGDEIHLIDLRFPDLDAAPRAYVRGRQLYGYNTELGSADANMVTKLTLSYSPLPTAPTLASQSLTIPDEWIDLVVLPTAKLMCLRDRRPEDAQALDIELKELYEIYAQALLIFDQGAARPIPSIPSLAGLGTRTNA